MERISADTIRRLGTRKEENCTEHKPDKSS